MKYTIALLCILFSTTAFAIKHIAIGEDSRNYIDKPLTTTLNTPKPKPVEEITTTTNTTMRKWQTIHGDKATAKLIGLTPTAVILMRDNGVKIKVKRSLLSPKDSKYIAYYEQNGKEPSNLKIKIILSAIGLIVIYLLFTKRKTT